MKLSTILLLFLAGWFAYDLFPAFNNAASQGPIEPRCAKCGYSNADAPTNQWPDAEISRDRFRAMLDNEVARREHAFRSNQHRLVHPELKP